jgi:hypothetical protein
MKYIKLFEEYSEEHYNRVLDLYSEKGLEGMTQEEIAYMKSGGTSEIPKSLFQKTIMNCPFVVTLGEVISRRYFSDDFWKTGEGISKPWTKEGSDLYLRMQKDRNISYRTFVFNNYKPIVINSSNKRWIDSVDWDSDYFHDEWKPNAEKIDGKGGQRWSEDMMERMRLRYFHDNYEEGLVMWYFDCQFPTYTNMWNEWVSDGGLQEQSGGSELIRSTVRDTMGYNVPEDRWNVTGANPIQVDLRGQKLTIDNILNEIRGLDLRDKLGDWTNDSEYLLRDQKERYLPRMSWPLFDNFY